MSPTTNPSRKGTTSSKARPLEGPVAVIGVTGQVGSRVAKLLAKDRVEVRGVARHPYDYTGTGRVDLVSLDCREAAQAREAVEGAAAVYLTPPLGRRDPLGNQHQVTSSVIQAARNADVSHVVVHTALHAKERDTGAHVIDDKGDIEDELKSSGLGYTILRPGWFMDNLIAERDLLAGGTLALPLPPERRLGVVAARDIARAAAALVQGAPQNRGFDLHVPGGVDGGELAEAATRALGQPVVYRELSVDDFLQQAAGTEKQKALQRELYEYLHSHDFLGHPSDIRTAVPGFRYTSVQRFMRRRLMPAAATTEPLQSTPWMPAPPVPPLRPGNEGPPGGPEPPLGPEPRLDE